MTTLLEAARVVSSLIANRPLGGYWPELSRALTDLANEIAAAESAPAVVTAEEIAAVGANCDDWNKRHKYECKEGILEWRSADSEVAALVAERTAAAVEAARAEEREAAAGIADRATCESANAALRSPEPNGGGDYSTRRHHEECAARAHRIAAAIRARGQSEASAPATPVIPPEPGHTADCAAWPVALVGKGKLGRVRAMDACSCGGTPAALSEEALGDIRRTLRGKEDALPFSQQLDLLGEVTRLRAREARVQALVEAAEGVLRWLDTSTGLPSEIALRAALDELGKEGA